MNAFLLGFCMVIVVAVAIVLGILAFMFCPWWFAGLIVVIELATLNGLGCMMLEGVI